MQPLGQTLGSTLLSRQFESLLWMYTYRDGALSFAQRVHTNNLHQFIRSRPRLKKFADLQMLVGQAKHGATVLVIASQRSLTQLELMALQSLVASALEKVKR